MRRIKLCENIFECSYSTLRNYRLKFERVYKKKQVFTWKPAKKGNREKKIMDLQILIFEDSSILREYYSIDGYEIEKNSCAASSTLHV